MTQHVQVIIVGAGSAGRRALHEVRRATDDYLVINDGDWGTTCAARGCMPSKALIEAANAFHSRTKFDAFGVRGSGALEVDVPAVLARVRAFRDEFAGSLRDTPQELGSRAIAGRAALEGPTRLTVNGTTYTADRVVLATGSTPIVPEPWRAFGARTLTTDTLFEQETLPQRIAVIGLGAIGVELAQALSRLGHDVAGFDGADRIAGLRDPEVESSLRASLGAEFPIHVGENAEVEDRGDTLHVEGAGGVFEADALLVAVGRRPNVEGLGLETLGVPLDERGLPAVDPLTLQVGDLPVFMAGDGNADRPLLHEAADEGVIAGRNAVSEEVKGHCRRVPLAITFCSPNAARIGRSFDELGTGLGGVAVGEANFARQARARMGERAAGRLRVYAAKSDGRLLGAELATPGGEHLAHLLALALDRELTVHQLLAAPFYHPVLEEGLRAALRKAAKEIEVGGDELADCGDIGQAAFD